MARPTGRFFRQTERLLEQLKYLESNKSNAELAFDLDVGTTQISKYINHLKKNGKIDVKVVFKCFRDPKTKALRKFSVRTIEVKS